jgi:hypothetical protein
MTLAAWIAGIFSRQALAEAGTFHKIARSDDSRLAEIFAQEKCGALMKVVAFITGYAAMDRIIVHLKLLFIAEKPPRSHVFEQVTLMAAEENAYYSQVVVDGEKPAARK